MPFSVEQIWCNVAWISVRGLIKIIRCYAVSVRLFFHFCWTVLCCGQPLKCKWNTPERERQRDSLHTHIYANFEFMTGPAAQTKGHKMHWWCNCLWSKQTSRACHCANLARFISAYSRLWPQVTLCRELMNNLDGITSPLVALQLLSLCLPLSLMSDNVIMELALHVHPMVKGCEYTCVCCPFYWDKVTSSAWC